MPALRFFLCLLLLANVHLNAQFVSARIGVDGLTCSACTNATEQSLLKLDCVAYVEMDLNENTARVMFKKDKTVDIQQLAKRVYAAGFSVRDLYAVFEFDAGTPVSGSCFQYAGKQYALLGGETLHPTGKTELKFIGKNLCTKKVVKSLKGKMNGTCNGAKPDYYFMIES